MSNSFLRDFPKGRSVPGRTATLYLQPWNKDSVVRGAHAIKAIERLSSLSIVLADGDRPQHPNVVPAAAHGALEEMMDERKGHLPNMRALAIVAEHSRNDNFTAHLPTVLAMGFERHLDELYLERVKLNFCALLALTERGQAKHVRLCNVTANGNKIHPFATNRLRTLEFNGVADHALVLGLVRCLPAQGAVRLIYSPSDHSPVGWLTKEDWASINGAGMRGVASLCLRNVTMDCSAPEWNDLVAGGPKELILENAVFHSAEAFEMFLRAISNNNGIFSLRLRNTFEGWDDSRYRELFAAVARSRVRWLECTHCPITAVEQLAAQLRGMAIEVLHLEVFAVADQQVHQRIRAGLLQAARENFTLGAIEQQTDIANERGIWGITVKTIRNPKAETGDAAETGEVNAPFLDRYSLWELQEICDRNYKSAQARRAKLPPAGSPGDDHFRLPANVGHDSSVETNVPDSAGDPPVQGNAPARGANTDPLEAMIENIASHTREKRTRSPLAAQEKKQRLHHGE